MNYRTVLLIVACIGTLCVTSACTELIEDNAVAPLPTLTPSPIAPILPTTTPGPTDPPPTPTPIPPDSTPLTPTVEGISVEYFVSSPDSVGPNENFQLFWATDGGASAAIFRLNDDGTPGQTWSVETEGSLTVTSSEGGDEIYILSLTDGVTTIEERLVVDVACSVQWFFRPEPDGCPDSQQIDTLATVQQFERGRMFWFEAIGQVIILFQVPPSQVSEDNPAWIRFDDTFDPAIDPVEDEGIQAPDGFFEPENQLGKVWRDNPEAVRDALGWATQPAVRYPAVIQTGQIDEQTQFFFIDNSPSGAVYRLLPDGLGWQVVGNLR